MIKRAALAALLALSVAACGGSSDSPSSDTLTIGRASEVTSLDPQQITTGQDVGRVLHPTQLTGQIEGGIAQGLGLAVMEEIVQVDGRIRNASFTDYLLPTMLDMPPVLATLVEEPDPQAPLGAKGVGEPPCISSTPAIAIASIDPARLISIDSDVMSKCRPSSDASAIVSSSSKRTVTSGSICSGVTQ